MSTEETSDIILPLTCPYCGTTNHTPSDPRHAGHSPRQIEITPYTRSKGEFEAVNYWSRIGLDFFAELVNWEAIGILRVPEGDLDLDISYQLIQCAQCNHYFDVYLNWTPERGFDELWPHLFDRDEHQHIKRYKRLPRTFDMLDKLGFMLSGRSFLSATMMAAIVLFVVSFIPRIFIAYHQNPGAALEEFWRISAIAVFTRVIGSVVLVYLLYHSRSYMHHMHSTTNFNPLFAVQKPDHITHWLNFTTSRVSGAQLRSQGYSITQSSILAGFPSAIILLATWLISRLKTTSGCLPTTTNLGLLAALVFIGYLTGTWLEFRSGKARRVLSKRLIEKRPTLSHGARSAIRKLDWFVPLTGARVRGLVWGLGLWFAVAVAQMIRAQPSEWEWVIDGLFEALFWMVIAFYIGTHVQLAFTMSIYVLFQVSRIPLNVHPLLGFAELTPVKKLVHTFTMILAAVLLMVLALSILEVLPWEQIGLPLPTDQVLKNTTWLFDWVTIGVLLMFFVLGFIISRWIPLGVILYGGLLLASNAWMDTLPACIGSSSTEVCREIRPALDVSIIRIPIGSSEISLWPSLILIGAFVYLVGLVYIEATQQRFVKLQHQAKAPYLERLNQRIVELSHNMLTGPTTQEKQGLFELIQVRDYIEGQESDRSLSRLALDTALPFILFFVPPIIELSVQSLGIPF